MQLYCRAQRCDMWASFMHHTVQAFMQFTYPPLFCMQFQALYCRTQQHDLQASFMHHTVQACMQFTYPALFCMQFQALYRRAQWRDRRASFMHHTVQACMLFTIPAFFICIQFKALQAMYFSNYVIVLCLPTNSIQYLQWQCICMQFLKYLCMQMSLYEKF